MKPILWMGFLHAHIEAANVHNTQQPIMILSEENMWTVVLLILSNIFMTYAWYGHLKNTHTNTPLILVILMSWGIAFFEYCLQVPANRMGYRIFTATQLKIIQECISLTVFVVFAVLYLKETIRWNYIVSFAFIALAVFFAFKKF
ncbi:hypothetical protein SAMN05444373_102930 [Thermoclostridium caenicola]|uniref:DMT family protein n=2 Tax=Thermoclostridium caenicola TaxID=659425 RepID=A0A1M6H5E2_9FIRM|nr:hypothetical protein SAMN05444373_102930 [Thermoclostridium caenicola]